MATAQNTTPNITFDISDAPIRVPTGCRMVRVTRSVQTAKRILEPGMFVIVEPGKTPTPVSTVLCGSRLEPWSGQPHEGVAIFFADGEILN